MDSSLCGSEILLALQLTGFLETDTIPWCFLSFCSKTERLSSINVCCTVAALMFHLCVLSFISKEWPASRERGFPDSHISLAPVVIPLTNHLRDPTQTPGANDILLSFLCDLLHVFNSHTDF